MIVSGETATDKEHVRDDLAVDDMAHIFAFSLTEAVSAVVVDGVELLPSIGHLLSEFQAAQWPNGALPEEGRVFVIQDDASPHPFMNSFISSLRNDGSAPRTCLNYVNDLRVFNGYCRAVYEIGLLAATTAVTGAYRSHRVDSGKNKLAGASWKRHSASLTRFFSWASDPEVALINASPKTRYRGRGGGGDTITSLDMRDYVALRDVGILGKRLDGRPDEGFAGRSPLRNAAYVELAVTSGFRVEEQTLLLACELPSSDSAVFASAKQYEFPVSSQITKGNVGRKVPLSRRVVLKYVEPYMRAERADAVEKWRFSEGYNQLGLIFGVLKPRNKIFIIGEDAPRPISSLTRSERRVLAILPREDAERRMAEPALLWLKDGGGFISTGAIWAMMTRAADRLNTLRRESTNSHEITAFPHILRHTFAVYRLDALIRSAFKVLSASEYENFSPSNSVEIAKRFRDGGENVVFTDRHDGARGYQKIIFDPVRRLQRWMGHKEYGTTAEYLDHLPESMDLLDYANEIFDEFLDGAV